MKQGRATHSGMGDMKREPVVHKVSPTAVARMGASQGTHITEKGEVPNRTPPLYPGRGLEAPLSGHHTYPHGSQGKHK